MPPEIAEREELAVAPDCDPEVVPARFAQLMPLDGGLFRQIPQASWSALVDVRAVVVTAPLGYSRVF